MNCLSSSKHSDHEESHQPRGVDHVPPVAGASVFRETIGFFIRRALGVDGPVAAEDAFRAQCGEQQAHDEHNGDDPERRSLRPRVASGESEHHGDDRSDDYRPTPSPPESARLILTRRPG